MSPSGPSRRVPFGGVAALGMKENLCRLRYCAVFAIIFTAQVKSTEPLLTPNVGEKNGRRHGASAHHTTACTMLAVQCWLYCLSERDGTS